jgi:hypothetical protein
VTTSNVLNLAFENEALLQYILEVLNSKFDPEREGEAERKRSIGGLLHPFHVGYRILLQLICRNFHLYHILLRIKIVTLTSK